MLWLHKNLFDGLIMSMVSLVLIVMLSAGLYLFIEWAFINAVWHSETFAACRQIIDTLHGESATGACWGIFTGTGNQFLFGAYPEEHYWRALIVLALLPVALLPILVSAVPSKYLAISAIYPVSAYVLILGGFGLEEVSTWSIGGILLIVLVSISAIVIAISAGLLLVLGRQFLILPLRVLCSALIELFNGVPLIIWLIFGAGCLNYFLPPSTSFYMIYRAPICLALPSAALIAHCIKGNLDHINTGQWEAGCALGFSRRSTFWLIIFPQALKYSVPRTILVSAGLFRDTTLLSIIGLYGPLTIVQNLRSNKDWSGTHFEALLVLGLCYWFISFAISSLSNYYARKLDNELGYRYNHYWP